MKKIILSITFLLLSTSAFAQSFPKTGYVQNKNGKKCWYTQTLKKDSHYFYESLKANINIITFKNSKCMVDNATNEMMINNVISRWYSYPDANFQTRVSELYDGSRYQKKGKCIQSKKYPAIGIMVDYIVKGNYLTGVIHRKSLMGCKNK
jgi:hypothetical protein